MNDEHLEIINELQGLLNISYREAYQIVDEYLVYGDVDLSDFDEIDNISQLLPKDVSLSLNMKENKQDSISQLIPRDREIMLNILNNQDSISKLNIRDKEIMLDILANQDTLSLLNTNEKEIMLDILSNQENKDTKIDLLTTKSSEIELDVSKSDNESVQFLDIHDKELSIDIEFGEPKTPNTIDLDNINPLSISSISSIYHNEMNVNTLDILSLSDISMIKEIEQEELKQLSLNDIRDVPSINLSNIELLDIGSISQLSKKLPSTRLEQLRINEVSSVPDIGDLPHIEVLSINKLDNFKWGRINARVNRNDLPLLFMNNIREVSNVEHSDIEQLALYDVPQLSDFNVSELEELTFEQLYLDDSLDVLNEIIESDILPPVTKNDFIKAGADPDTVDMYFNDYLSTSESYSLETIRLFFKHALSEKVRAIEAGGNYKGLYKIVTEERGTFLPFITELYMTELCQYDEDVGTVIIRYHSMLEGFLINEAHYYNSLI